MTTAPRRIGFVDHLLENYHANTFLAALRGPLAERGYVVAGACGSDPQEARTWCEKNQVPCFASVAELDAAADVYVILAPSHPEKHLALCEAVLPLGKPTYLDKPIAQDLATTEAIFALADRHGVALQSTSVLRYTNIQQSLDPALPVQHLLTWGSGRSFEEYGIHPTELLVSCLGAGATRLRRRGNAAFFQLLIDYPDGRTGTIHFAPNSDTAFHATLTTAQGTTHAAVAGGAMFVDAMGEILRFFDAGTPQIDRAETLLIRRILDAAEDPAAATDAGVSL